MGLKARLDETQKEKAQKAVDELIRYLRKAIERNGGNETSLSTMTENAGAKDDEGRMA
jgi:hypothetical protein